MYAVGEAPCEMSEGWFVTGGICGAPVTVSQRSHEVLLQWKPCMRRCGFR